MLCDDPYASQYNLPRQAVLISQLQAIDNEAQSMLAQVIESNRAVGGYMRAIDKKIRCIAKAPPLWGEDLDLEEAVHTEGVLPDKSGFRSKTTCKLAAHCSPTFTGA